MSEDVAVAVDRYIEGLFGGQDAVLEAAQQRAADAGLPAISVSAPLGRFLHVLALACGARQVLEIGTLAGYSAIWMARALAAGGRLVTLEANEEYAEIAGANVADAGLDDVIEIRRGRALETLAELEREQAGPFDLVFLDADKEPYTEYLQAALRLSRPGTLIVADNVVYAGQVLSEEPSEMVAGLQRFNRALAAESGVRAAIVQTTGVKGHDGMALAVVREA